MAKLQLKLSGVGKGAAEGGSQYSGPALVDGAYTVRLKRMTHSAIGMNPSYSGNYKGADRFNILFEVVEPAQFAGAPIWDGVNVIDPSIQYVNQFLYALAGATTPGAQKVVEKAFYEGDITTKTVARQNGTQDVHIVKIGNITVNSPNGERLIQVNVKLDAKQDGKPTIKGYFPYAGQQQQASNGVANDLLGDVEDDLLAGEDEPFAAEADDLGELPF